MPPKISEDKILKIKEGILNNKFYDDIAKELNISKDCVFRYAKKLGLSTGKNFKRKSKLNENCFANIDDSNKAYWLGFIMADGGVCYTTNYYKQQNKPNRLYINLSIKDKETLINLKEFLNTDKEVEKYTPKGTYSENAMCRLIINSTRLCRDLSIYGIHPGKTGYEIIPELSNDMLPHFIRGYFDGDGCIYINQKEQLRITFSGNKTFLESLQTKLISNNILSSKTKITKQGDKNCYLFCINKQSDINNFYKYIYQNSKVHMERKFNKFGNSLY